MIYSFNHEKKLEQGDICWKLPMITSSQIKYPLENYKDIESDIWENYATFIKNEEIIDFQMSITPTIVTGVVLSQTCDIRKENDVIFGRLLEYPKNNWPNNRKKIPVHIKKILRDKTREHYFPDPISGTDITDFPGPYYLNLKQIFLLPANMILNNIEVFWKARLIESAKKVLCEKIQRFFTRLPFDDILFFTTDQIKMYYRQNGVTEEEIKRVLSSVGRDNELNTIFDSSD